MPVLTANKDFFFQVNFHEHFPVPLRYPVLYMLLSPLFHNHSITDDRNTSILISRGENPSGVEGCADKVFQEQITNT